MNEQNEINGDLQDEYNVIQAAELFEESPENKLTSQDIDDWYQSWFSDNNNNKEQE